ncbi:MAG: dicarboxylate/amino acid:cation symporter [Planctomycetota bacterium]
MKIKVHIQILIALALGVVTGLVLKENAQHLRIIGDIFINLLKMIMIPLIMASMITGIVSIGNIRSLGRIGFKTFIYYMATTLISVTIGLILVNLINPGVGMTMPEQSAEASQPPSLISLIMSIVPENIFEAMAQGKVLSIIFFSLLFGTAISIVGEKAKPVAAFFEALNRVMFKLTGWIMRLAPYGVFALIASVVGTMGLKAIGSLARYMITVTIGLLIHGCIILPVLLIAFGRYSPLKFIKDMFNAVATAFSTASSAAAFPVTMECVEENAGVSNKVASFVLPLGATINMDGTALYEAVAAMFIAQAYGIDLSIGQQLIVVLTATLASVGAAAIPGAGMITMAIVLKAVGLPLEGLGLIVAVDRLLDMCRTAVNVWGDSCGTVIIARLEGEKPAGN